MTTTISPPTPSSPTHGAPRTKKVSFDDAIHGREKSKAGYAKIIFCGQQALKDDLRHFWVDSCCINRNSDSERSEAINSMFRWYSKAAKCYVYLQDVSALKRDRSSQATYNWEAAFRKSRWFTRGCMSIAMRRTLQELLAPKVVEFWSRDIHLLGTKASLKDLISDITGIPLRALCGVQLSEFSSNERLRWAAKRETKKMEDKAYSLFGIFGVSLPLIYGEGDKAFVRLRNEIDRDSHSHQESSKMLEQSRLSDSTIQERSKTLLASLSFDQIDSRQNTIKEAQRTTCEWILQHATYIAWSKRDKPLRHREILWIAGKPGAGKSTLMKFVLARAKKSKLEDRLSYLSSETREETISRKLHWSVLDNVDTPNLSQIQSSTWSLGVLQELLSTALHNLKGRRVKCFIDALDECDEQQVRDMVEFLEDLGGHVLNDDSRLYVCFASRHYPTIEIHDGWRLVLEDQAGHAEDLRKYINRRLQAGKGKLIHEIQAQIQEKANGVFMWAVLVVDILNEEFRRGRIFAVRQRLQEIPPKLSDLFKDILRRDCVHMDDLLLCLQWILFAKRPLRREEFYFAMVTGLRDDPDDVTEWRPDPWDPEEVTAEDMNEFVLNSSKGLAELTRSKTNPIVQFIHESVRDFLIKDRGLHQLWPELDVDLPSLSHEKLKKCCSDYISADISSHIHLPQPLPKASSDKATTIRQEVSSKFPFLEYASKEVLYHANEAAYGLDQEKFLEAFDLDKWIHITNVCERYDIRRHSSRVNLVYVLAENNLPRLIKALQYHDKWLRLAKERYQFPALAAFAAFANGHREALQELLGDGGVAFIDDITKDPGFGKASHCGRSEDLLLWAIENKNSAFAACLLTSFSDKAKFGMTTVVQLLLDTDDEATAQENNRSNALYVVSGEGHEKAVSMLLDAGADVNAQGGYFGNALQAALGEGNEKVVSMLLDAGADVNAQGVYFGNTLQAALERRHEKVVSILIERGARKEQTHF